MRERRVIISGGGTGGHLYPALAVGQKLREKEPGLRLTYVGSHRQVEKNIMDQYGAHFIPLKIEGIKGRGLRSLKTIALLPLAFIKSLAILLRCKPNLVIGVGGYSSGPIVLIASLMKTPTLILEQNVRPGFTNRLLLRWSHKAVVAFENSLAFFKGKGIHLGNPVREEFYHLRPKPRTKELTLLIFGGSQGARILNKTMAAALPLIKPEKENLRIIHQTGKADFDWVKASYLKNGFDEAEVSSYFFDMPGCFEKADLIISRSGATTCAEIIVAQKASILIPFARAAEDHQTQNARELERAKAAEVVAESELTPELLAQKILSYLRNKDRITEMGKKLAGLRKDSPAEMISNLCFELMEAKA